MNLTPLTSNFLDFVGFFAGIKLLFMQSIFIATYLMRGRYDYVKSKLRCVQKNSPGRF